MNKLTYPPDQDGYTVKDGEEVLSVALDGGLPRFRKDILNSASELSVRWTLSQSGYRYLRAFYNTATFSGSIPFLVDLIIDAPELTEHTAYFIPKSMRLTNQKGLSYIVQASLVIEPQTVDHIFNSGFMVLFDAYGDDWASYLNPFEVLGNFKWIDS